MLSKRTIVLFLVSMLCSSGSGATFRFTVTSDLHDTADSQYTLGQIRQRVGGAGAFHISVGDEQNAAGCDAKIASELGSNVIWYAAVGNHDDASTIGWIRQHNSALPYKTRLGPTNCENTMFSFDYGNVHFVVLNQYYDGSSDVGALGKGNAALVYDWLVSDLNANTNHATLVFNHNSSDNVNAAPYQDYLDDHPELWQLLSERNVLAYFSGHWHDYYRAQYSGTNWDAYTWKIDTGNGGSMLYSNRLGFMDITVSATEITFDEWSGSNSGAFQKTDTFTMPIEGTNASPPTINNADGASGITTNSAWLNGNLVSTGNIPTSAWVYWGASDGGTDKTAWANSQSFGQRKRGPLSAKAAGLTTNATYYYRYYATNAAGEGWAPATASFTTLPGPPTWSEFGHKIKIAFSGYDKPETLTNFPALVVLSESMPNFAYSQFASTNGWDLRFQNPADGADLSYEVERWDPAGTSFAWVQVPVISGTNTCVWAHWGTVESVVTSAPAYYATNGATWSQGYAGVWHMGSQAGSNALDSTAAKRDGYMKSISESDWKAGVAGNAFDFDGANDYMSLALAMPSNNCTMEYWIRTTTASRGLSGVYGEEQSGLQDDFIFIDGVGNVRIDLSAEQIYSAGMAVTNGQWHHVAHVLGTQIGGQRIFVDGVQGLSGTHQTIPIVQRRYVKLGWNNLFGYHDGMMDDIRISSVIRSSNWLWACFMNVASNSVFNSYGSVTNNTAATGGFVDNDGDGMDDNWELHYFGGMSAFNGSAQQDWDGDNAVNLYEYIAGTNPTNQLSCFRVVAITNDAGRYAVIWRSVTNRTYSVFKTTNLLEGWIAASLETNLTGNVSGVNTFLNSNATDMSAFYKIKVQRP